MKARHLVIAILLTLSIAWTASAQTPLRIAYVDLNEAALTVKEGKEIANKLKKLVQQKKSNLEKEQEALKRLKEELEKQAPMMKEDVRRKKLLSFQEKVESFQQAYLDSQKELAAKEQELTAPILRKMVQISEEIAKELGYDMILRKEIMIYAQSNMDLTDELIKRYNKKYGK